MKPHKTPNGEYVDLRDWCADALAEEDNDFEHDVLMDILYFLMGDAPSTTDQLRDEVIDLLTPITTTEE